MEVFPASVVLIIRALVVSARWAGRSRRFSLEQMTAAAETSRIGELAAGKQEAKPRQIGARYPHHVWSVDRTRV